MNMLVIHSILGLSWDELGQIVTIVSAFVALVGWANHCHNKSLEKNFRLPMNKVWRSVDGLHTSVDDLRSELHTHAEKSTRGMVKLQDKFDDHEKRISWIETLLTNLKKLK